MNEEEVQVVDSAETTTEVDNSQDYENDSNGEGEGTQADKGSVERKPETPEQRVARLKRQLEREERKLGGKDQETRKEGGKESSKEVDERYARLELKTEGITSKKEQDIVLEYANWKGIDPAEALKIPAVKAELAELRSKASVPPPSNRTGGGASNSIEYWAAQAKKGNFPQDPAIRRQLRAMRIFTK